MLLLLLLYFLSLEDSGLEGWDGWVDGCELGEIWWNVLRRFTMVWL